MFFEPFPLFFSVFYPFIFSDVLKIVPFVKDQVKKTVNHVSLAIDLFMAVAWMQPRWMDCVNLVSCSLFHMNLTANSLVLL